jgi:hypothetical protein
MELSPALLAELGLSPEAAKDARKTQEKADKIRDEKEKEKEKEKKKEKGGSGCGAPKAASSMNRVSGGQRDQREPAQAAVKRSAASAPAASEPSYERVTHWVVINKATLKLTRKLDNKELRSLDVDEHVTSLERRGNRVRCATGGWASIKFKDGKERLKEKKRSKNDVEPLPLAERVRLKRPAAEGAGSLASLSSVRVRIDPASLRHVLP